MKIDLFNITYQLHPHPAAYTGDQLRRLAEFGIRTVALYAAEQDSGLFDQADRCKAAGLAVGVISLAHNADDVLSARVIDALRQAARVGASLVRVETSLLDGLETAEDVARTLRQFRHLETELSAANAAKLPVGLEPSRNGILPSAVARDLFHELDSDRLGISLNPAKLGSLAVGPTSSATPGENLRYNLRRFLGCYYLQGRRSENGKTVSCHLWDADVDFVSLVFWMHFSRDVPPDHIIVEDEAIERLLNGDEHDRFYLENTLSALAEYTLGHPGLGKSARNLANVAERSAWGKAELIPDRSVPVASLATYSLKLVIGPGGVSAGGEIRVQQPHLSNGGRMQTRFPDREGYVSVEASSAPATLRLYTRPYPLMELVINVAAGSLQEGDTLTITLGDTAGGSPGIFTNKDMADLRFRIGVWPSADAQPSIMADTPVLRVTNGPAARLGMVAPSVVEPGQPLALVIRADDEVGYPCRAQDEFAYAGNIELTTTSGRAQGERAPGQAPAAKESDSSPCGLIAPVELTDNDAGVKRIILSDVCPSAPTGSVFRIVARDPATGICGQSNPISCREAPERRLYWGEIHSHSTESDGRLPIDFLYRYARDYAALDFASSGDHGLADDPAKWDIAKEYAGRYNEPHRFVTLLGTEFSKPAPFGDRNAYFKTLDVPYCDCPRDLQCVWDWVAEHGGLLIPHQLASPPMAIDWQYFDPRVERLVEIASCHGNFEKPDMPYGVAARHGVFKGLVAEGSFYQDALARGYRLGVIGSSDAHDTHTGHTPYGSWRSSPLAAVWATELTREAIFQAMWDRRCYATSGARILLETWVNGAPMGGEIRRDASESGPVHVRASVTGTAELATIDIVRNNRDIYTCRPHSEEATFEFHDELDDAPDAGDLYYYLRVTQVDGEMAWSSPVWVAGGRC
jgi:hypothetical protein